MHLHGHFVLLDFGLEWFNLLEGSAFVVSCKPVHELLVAEYDLIELVPAQIASVESAGAPPLAGRLGIVF